MADENPVEKNEDYWKLNQGESFWEDALEYFLRGRLERIYKSKKFNRKLRRWLRSSEEKNALIHLTDIPSDPFLIKLRKDGYSARTVQHINFNPDLELTTDHISLMSFGYNPIYILPLIIFNMLKVKSRSFKDRWMFFRLILM
jgi:hypothetical protein